MSVGVAGGGAEGEAARGGARPLSGGLWTLFSWLRGADRASSGSSDSLSSVGSDRTVASFAFLSPDRYRASNAPILLPPPGPPADSYRKRVRDRNARLQHDRDLTLHRKYGLFRGENGGYDAFSLPSARRVGGEKRDRQDRERRATSESLQRRSAHVPGKRRAPPPPLRSATVGPSRPLNRSHNRKRPAPQPPGRLYAHKEMTTIPEEKKINKMNALPLNDNPSLSNNDSIGCKSEKYTKKEIKEVKPRTEKSFFKQIFENKKRNSAIDVIPERLLPSISELDKQAAEIIESCKLTAVMQGNDYERDGNKGPPMPLKGDKWFCTRCLRKYDDSVVTCVYCVSEQKLKLNRNYSKDIAANVSNSNYTQTDIRNVASTSKKDEAEEKQKLKDMLKEIKDSLPKRPKHEVGDSPNRLKTNTKSEASNNKDLVNDTPTLRIGSKLQGAENIENNLISKSYFATETAVVTQPIVLQHSRSRDIIKLENYSLLTSENKNKDNKYDSIAQPKISAEKNKVSNIPVIQKESNKPSTSSGNKNLSTPLKISMLLNPNTLDEGRIPKMTYFVPKPTNNQTQGCSTADIPTKIKPVLSNVTLRSDLSANSDINTKSPADKVLEPKTTQTQLDTSTKLMAVPATKKIISSSAENTQTDSSTKQDLSISSRLESNLPFNQKEKKSNNFTSINPPTVVSTPALKSSFSQTTPTQNKNIIDKDAKVDKGKSILKSNGITQKSSTPNGPTSSLVATNSNIVLEDRHSKRRDLINQLEQSIAKGDERSAADAAVKLAQLRLSCSVLSFSSQIVGAAYTSLNNQNENIPAPAQDSSSKKIQSEVSSPEWKPQIGKDDFQNKKNISPKPSTSQGPTTTEPKVTPNPRASNEASGSGYARNANEDMLASIQVWIEDREATRGPIKMKISKTAIMGDLRRQANVSLGVAPRLQRWIVGRTLCTEDTLTLNSLAGPAFNAPFYLYVVEPDTNKTNAENEKIPSTATNNENVNTNIRDDKSTNVYSELVLLERQAVVPNAEEFECGVCMENCAIGQGAVLRECVHTFCRDCLGDLIRHCEEPAVACPAMGCPGFLHEREIRALVSTEEYERWLARGLAAAESGTRNAFHCRTRDCTGWALCEPGVLRFPCPVCKRTNCVACQAIHEGETCEQHRARQVVSETSANSEQTDEGTRAFLQTLISKGEALECPECSAIITKKWGCDWIKCSACKTEICWVTRGRRWGPGGRGDTSAGCRCGVDGKRCHPSCAYCH